MANSQVIRVQNNVYLDNSGQAVNGYLLYVYLPDYDETLTINVPTLAEGVVKKAVDQLTKQRDALAKFSQPSK